MWNYLYLFVLNKYISKSIVFREAVNNAVIVKMVPEKGYIKYTVLCQLIEKKSIECK